MEVGSDKGQDEVQRIEAGAKGEHKKASSTRGGDSRQERQDVEQEDDEEEEEDPIDDTRELEHKKHVGFWLRHLRMLPRPYQSADQQRMSIVFFCLSALDLLGALEGDKVPMEERHEIADWIFAQQLDMDQGGGFLGSPAVPSGSAASSSSAAIRGHGHLAMTYTAMVCLAILGDDFSRLNRPAITSLLGALQQPDGSFAPCVGQHELDARFIYCAFAIAFMLQDWSTIDVQNALLFLRRSISYDGAFGQAPKQESHGGSSYCATAALALFSSSQSSSRTRSSPIADHILEAQQQEEAKRWLLARQVDTGFNGRIGKAQDVCYSFWCGAALHNLGAHEIINAEADVAWILSAQSPVGGVAKTPGEHPDAMHSYLALAALSMHAHDATLDERISGLASNITRRRQLESIKMLKRLDPLLNMSMDAYHNLERSLHAKHKTIN